MTNIFKAPAIISKISTMADRTIRLQCDCQEMDSGDEAIILKARNKSGWFLFAETEMTERELSDMKLPDYKPIEKGDKTPSARLRAVIFILWKQKGKVDMYGKQCTFDDFYKEIIEFYIGQIKNKLEG